MTAASPEDPAREPSILVLDRDAVRACLAGLDPAGVVESVLRRHAEGSTILPPEAYLSWTNSADAYSRSLAMPGAVLGADPPAYGLKVINAAVSNPSLGLERAGGVTMLFDAETARVRVLAEAGLLSALRTAAYTMVSLRHLGPLRFADVTLLGCGTLARAHAELLARYQPQVRTLHVFDAVAGRAQAFASWAHRHTGQQVVVEPDARTAVGASSVLVTLTTSDAGYIGPDWLRPGTFVAHVSLDDLHRDAFTGAEAVFVDDLDLVRDNPRRILGRLMAEGSITEPGAVSGTRLAGTLPDVLAGRLAAVRPHRGTVISNPFGMSVLDIGLVAAVAQVAERTGAGTTLRLV